MTNTNLNDIHLEPRVARLETSMETLTRTVSDLAVSVRDSTNSTNQKIDNLVVSVTQAQAPKKTDWSLFISIGFFILALGSAVFWPLNKTGQDNKAEIQSISTKLDNHTILDSHPVSAVLLKRLEEQLINHTSLNERELRNHMEFDNKEFINLDKKLQTEYTLMNSKIETQIFALDTKVQLEMKLLGETVDNRLKALEHITDRQDTMDLLELRAWRNKANGLSSPNMAIPLIPKEIQIDQSKK